MIDIDSVHRLMNYLQLEIVDSLTEIMDLKQMAKFREGDYSVREYLYPKK